MFRVSPLVSFHCSYDHCSTIIAATLIIIFGKLCMNRNALSLMHYGMKHEKEMTLEFLPLESAICLYIFIYLLKHQIKLLK